MKTKTIQVNDKEIKVLQYLPIKDKNDYVYITLQQAEQGGLYNVVKLNMYRCLNVVKMYTDLAQPADMSDEEWFDELVPAGVVREIYEAIPHDERLHLEDWLEQAMDMQLKYGGKIGAVLSQFINDLPKNAEKANEILKNFNPEDYQQVIDFARAANGNRDI